MSKSNKPLNWSRYYFTKQESGKYQCNFGCGSSYFEHVGKMQNHLLNQCKKIGPEARSKINIKAGIKQSPEVKRQKVADLLSSPSTSTSIPRISKTSTLLDIGNFVDRMNVNEQNELDILLTRALITGNVPAIFLDNPFFKLFCKKMRPSYKLPSRNSKFSKALVPAEYERVHKIVEKSINEADYLAVSSDGWSDIKGNRLINVVTHTPKPFLFKSIDATETSHDAAFICLTLSKVIENLGPQKTAAVVTDHAPSMKAGWKLLNEKYPWIVFEGCKAHALDLAAKDLCKLDFVVCIVDKCIEIAKFFRKNIPKLVLEETQRLTIGHSRLLQLPGPTRWFSKWTLTDSIKANEACLRSSIWSPKIVENTEIKKKQDRLKTLQRLLCDDTDFWSNLVLVEELLRPFKATILSIEGSVVDVSNSYKIVGSAFNEAREVASKFPIDQSKLINEILTDREDFCKSDVVYVLELLNPSERGQSLSRQQERSAINMISTKFLKNPVFAGLESKFFAEVAQFKAQTGDFDNEHWAWSALETGDVDALTFWSGCFPNSILATIYKMIRMIPITSAVTERNWSIRGAIHTKVRNRLAVETVSMLTYIKHNLILDNPKLFKNKRRQEAELHDDEIIEEVTADDIIISDC